MGEVKGFLSVDKHSNTYFMGLHGNANLQALKLFATTKYSFYSKLPNKYSGVLNKRVVLIRVLEGRILEIN